MDEKQLAKLLAERYRQIHVDGISALSTPTFIQLARVAIKEMTTDARYGFFGDQTLFQSGDFVAASGLTLPWKVECDVLSYPDWQWAAKYVSEQIKFGEVEGVPWGGLQFATALHEYRTEGCGLLIVDDVMTAGASISKYRGDRDAKGFVLFSRGDNHPEWVNAIWRNGKVTL